MFWKKKNKSLGAFKRFQSYHAFNSNLPYRISFFEVMLGLACKMGVRSEWDKSTLELLEAYYEYKRGVHLVHLLHEPSKAKKHNHREFLVRLRMFRKEFRKLANENKI